MPLWAIVLVALGGAAVFARGLGFVLARRSRWPPAPSEAKLPGRFEPAGELAAYGTKKPPGVEKHKERPETAAFSDRRREFDRKDTLWPAPFLASG